VVLEYKNIKIVSPSGNSNTFPEHQVLFTKKMTPVVAQEYGEVTLEVEVGLDSGEVQWMRQGVLIHPGPKSTLKHNGRSHSLTLHKLAISDRGTYSCETLHDRTQAQLTVERECACVCHYASVLFVYRRCRPRHLLHALRRYILWRRSRLSTSNLSDRWGPGVALVPERDGNQQVIA